VVPRNEQKGALGFTYKRAERAKEFLLRSDKLGFLAGMRDVSTERHKIRGTEFVKALAKMLVENLEEAAALSRRPYIPMKIGEVPPDERLICHTLFALEPDQFSWFNFFQVNRPRHAEHFEAGGGIRLRGDRFLRVRTAAWTCQSSATARQLSRWNFNNRAISRAHVRDQTESALLRPTR
jgi:hypothetical protein